jgi:hypothetical protein
VEWELVLPKKSDVAAAAANLTKEGNAVDQADATATVRDPWGTQLRLVASGD